MAFETLATLHYAVRGRVILKYLGQLFRMLALLTLVPCLASMLFGEWTVTLAYGALAAFWAIVGWPLGRMEVPTQIQTNEALVITALIFVIAPTLGALPMTAAGLGFSDALFEAISGVTTTGLSTFADIEDKPNSFLFARAWMQWYGGLGVVVLSVALIMGHAIAARRLIEASTSEGLATTTRVYARRVLSAYLVLTLAGIALLWPFSDNAFDAVVHTLTAVSTGGFSNFNASLAGVPSTGFQLTVSFLSLAGAIALPLYLRSVQHGLGILLADLELRWLLGLTMSLWFVLAALLITTGFETPAALFHAFTLAASAQSTTGFSTLPVSILGPTALAVLIPAMLIGGGVGSTAGGIKLLRLLMLVEVAKAVFVRPGLAPHAVWQPKIGEKPLEAGEANLALVLLALFVGVIFLSWLPFLLYGYDPLASLFEVVSATCTVGLSTGITAEDMPTLLKYVLCVDMLLGRVEIIALLLLFFPPTWIGKRSETP